MDSGVNKVVAIILTVMISVLAFWSYMDIDTYAAEPTTISVDGNGDVDLSLHFITYEYRYVLTNTYTGSNVYWVLASNEPLTYVPYDATYNTIHTDTYLTTVCHRNSYRDDFTENLTDTVMTFGSDGNPNPPTMWRDAYTTGFQSARYNVSTNEEVDYDTGLPPIDYDQLWADEIASAASTYGS